MLDFIHSIAVPRRTDANPTVVVRAVPAAHAPLLRVGWKTVWSAAHAPLLRVGWKTVWSAVDARKWWWSEVKKGYFDYGIEVFWLDAAEPEQMNGSPPGSAFSTGSFDRAGMMFPYYHTQTYYDGMSAAGSKDFMMLSRSAWAGMQKHRAALWNGDTHSTWPFLKTAVQASILLVSTGRARASLTTALFGPPSVSIFVSKRQRHIPRVRALQLQLHKTCIINVHHKP